MKTNLRLLVSALALAVVGCGGGGGGSDEDAPAPITLAQIQGFWNGPVSGADFGGATIARSVVLDDGRTWVFLHGAAAGEPLVGLATGRLAVSGDTFSGTGTRYAASGAVASSVTWAGRPVTNGLTVTGQTGAANAVSNFALTYDSRYETDAVQADVQGNWVFTQAGGTISGTWTIDASGALSGSRTPGCSYAGQVRPHAGVAVYDVTLTESCTGSAARTFAGIARLNTAKTFLTFGLTTTNGSEGTAFVVGRPAS